MKIKELILREVKSRKEIKVADIVKATGFSRAYISKMFKELKDEKKIFQVGKANQSRYILVDKKNINKLKKQILSSRKILKNKNLLESDVLADIKEKSGVFLDIPSNISATLDYTFTEILNNAIEHSRSEKINIFIGRNLDRVIFEITDFGIGIFKNVMKKRKLRNELEAIQDILKGKQTTSPKNHTGEGVFFTSKCADRLIIRSFGKKLIIDNNINDIFIEDIKGIKGTSVKFEIKTNSNKSLSKIFAKYSEEAFAFDKTEVVINLYKIDNSYISRSQARRVLVGLEKFKRVILDFKKVKTVGQAFADEVFRVWNNNHKNINIVYKNANENIIFMIERAKNRE